MRPPDGYAGVVPRQLLAQRVSEFSGASAFVTDLYHHHGRPARIPRQPSRLLQPSLAPGHSLCCYTVLLESSLTKPAAVPSILFLLMLLEDPWTRTPEQILQHFNVDSARGLTSDLAAKHAEIYGKNGEYYLVPAVL